MGKEDQSSLAKTVEALTASNQKLLEVNQTLTLQLAAQAASTQAALQGVYSYLSQVVQFAQISLAASNATAAAAAQGASPIPTQMFTAAPDIDGTPQETPTSEEPE
jgi:hypothetical protein